MSLFNRYKRSKDGLSSKCRECTNKPIYQVRTEGSKYCPDCKKTKEVVEFNKDKSKKDGLRTYCRKCENKRNGIYVKNVYRKNEAFKAKSRVRSKTNHAINAGKLKKKDECEICGSAEDIQVHHLSYDQNDSYVDIIFLCRDCHYEEHVRLNKDSNQLSRLEPQ